MNLYPHQEKAINELKNGNILCGDVGSGKSRTAVAYYFLKVCNGEMNINGKGSYSPMKNPLDLYIITTARKRDTHEWNSECIPFLISEDNENNSAGVKLTIDSWNNIEKYKNVQNAFFIFDEQRVVGYGSWSKAFIQISKNNKWILLSATPGDTWSDYIPVFIANGFYKNKTEFVRNHIVFSRYTKYPKVERYIQTERLTNILNSILVDMEFDRPAVSHYEYVQCGYDEQLYLRVVKDRHNLETGEPMRDIAELCRTLRKIVNTDSSRFSELLRIYEHHDRVIVFYNFNYELDLLKNFCIENDIIFSEWNGHRHEPIPSYDHWLYLVQYTAGAEGWNCILTDATVFFSQSYSYKQTVQAAGRINRMNTPYKNLYYYYLISNSSIDRAIKRTLNHKKDFNDKSFEFALINDQRKKQTL